MQKTTSFQTTVSSLEAPRLQPGVLCPLHEVLLPCLCGVDSGCESVVEIAECGKLKLEFLRRLSDLTHGTPS